jgi:hypothetical protein
MRGLMPLAVQGWSKIAYPPPPPPNVDRTTRVLESELSVRAAGKPTIFSGAWKRAMRAASPLHSLKFFPFRICCFPDICRNFPRSGRLGEPSGAVSAKPPYLLLLPMFDVANFVPIARDGGFCRK